MPRKPAIPEDPLVAEVLAEDPTLLRIPRRDSFRNPYRDGLPDTPEIIHAMTQGARDAILRAMPATKRGS